jgi:hypothetical protein
MLTIIDLCISLIAITPALVTVRAACIGGGTFGTQLLTSGDCAATDVFPSPRWDDGDSATRFDENLGSATLFSDITSPTDFAGIFISDGSSDVDVFNHGFTQICRCAQQPCSGSALVGDAACASGIAIRKVGGGFICVVLGDGTVPTGTSTTIALTSAQITGVVVDALTPVTYTFGRISFGADSAPDALILADASESLVLWTACGPFVLQTANTYNAAVSSATAGVPTSTAVGDPHLAGAHGIKFDVFGEPGAKYSLLVAPAFEINMQLATRGPELRFMTAMAVLYRGTSFTITPWTATKEKRAELITHFESLGSKISIKNWRITIELCAEHTISIESHHNNTMSYLNFEMQVPGCHDSYGGLLGQTYQCKYAKEKFKWSREHEKAFRIATLSTASGSYSPTGECAHEDEYHGKSMHGGSFSNGTLWMTTMH